MDGNFKCAPNIFMQLYGIWGVLVIWGRLDSGVVTWVNQQDFLQVFQGSGIGKMEDNLTSADPLSYYTTNGSQVDLWES